MSGRAPRQGPLQTCMMIVSSVSPPGARSSAAFQPPLDSHTRPSQASLDAAAAAHRRPSFLDSSSLFSHPSQSKPTKHDSQPASRPLPWTTWTLDPCSSASSSPLGRPPAPGLPLRLGPARPHSGEGVVAIPPDGLTHRTVLNLERPFPCCYSRRLMHAAPPSVQAAESLTWHAGGL
jgi:hypothetical protein